MSIEKKLEMLGQAKTSLEGTQAYKRLAMLFDDGYFTEIDSYAKSDADYAEAVAAYGTVNGCPTYAFAQNSDIQGGAMSRAQAAKIGKLYDLATKTGTPIIALYDSKGAKLAQGADMLGAYGDMLNMTSNIAGVVPQISVVLGPCFGVSAMIAATADIVIMSEKAQLSVETNGQSGDFSENEQNGVSHITAADDESAINKAKEVLMLLPSNNLCISPIADAYEAAASGDKLDAAAVKVLDGGDISDDIIAGTADEDSFVELQKEYGTAVRVGLARIGGTATGLVIYNGKKLDDASCSKAARFVRFCDCFSIPVVTFADSEGFETLKSAAKLSAAYAEATAAKITVITGQAYGAYYVAVAGKGANADVTLAWYTAAVHALNPVTASAMLWSDKLKNSSDPVSDRAKLVKEYRDSEADVFKAAANGYVQDVIEPSQTRQKLISCIEMLSSKRVSTLPRKHGNIQI